MSFSKREVEYALRTIFRRCVQCPDVTPSCPQCASDETCSLSSGDCNSCPSTSCVKTSTIDGSSSSSKPPVGAIAGGVIGGVVVILVATFLVWRFCIRNRRREYDEQALSEYNEEAEKSRDRFTMNRDARASTHTIGSIASTVLTRASNVIQIAYIPGVTNRSPPESPGFGIPPVPPLPLSSLNSSAASTPRLNQEQHFFMPGDLRDSTWSGTSEESRHSIAPSLARDLARDSVATTIYRDTAILSPNPTQTALRGKAAVVSVKNGSTSSGSPSPLSSPRNDTPPLPALDFQQSQFTKSEQPRPALAVNNSQIVARSFSAKKVTVLKKSPSSIRTPSRMNSVENSNDEASIADSATTDRRASKADSVASHTKAREYLASGKVANGSDDEDNDPHERSRRYLTEKHGDSQRLTVIEDSPALEQGPFGDSARASSPTTGASSALNPEISNGSPNCEGNDSGPSHRHRKSTSLSELIQEATRRASRPLSRGLGSYESVPELPRRDLSPFSDENELRGP